MNENRIKELFSRESFVNQLLGKETPEEVQALLAEKDISVGISDVIQAREILIEQSELLMIGEELNLAEDVPDGCAALLKGFDVAGIAAVVYFAETAAKARW